MKEVVVNLDHFCGEQGRNDGGGVLNGNFGSQVDPGIVQRFLDGPEESGRVVVQGRDVKLGDGSCRTGYIKHGAGQYKIPLPGTDDDRYAA
jgi:hypothetical protein